MAQFKKPKELEYVVCPFRVVHVMHARKLSQHMRNCPNSPLLGGQPDNPNLVQCKFTEHHWLDEKHMDHHLKYDCSYAAEALYDILNKTKPDASIKANKENIPPPTKSDWNGNSDDEEDSYSFLGGQKRSSSAAGLTTADIIAAKKRTYQQYCEVGSSALQAVDSYSWMFKNSNSANSNSKASDMSSGDDTVFGGRSLKTIDTCGTPSASTNKTLGSDSVFDGKLHRSSVTAGRDGVFDQTDVDDHTDVDD